MRLSISYKEMLISFDVVYRNRKTMEIRITPPSTVTVITPEKLKQEDIIKMVKKKESWIYNKLEKFEKNSEEYTMKEYIKGEEYLYLGYIYTLDFKNSGHTKINIYLESNIIVVDTAVQDRDIIKTELEEWYRKRAINVIEQRVSLYQSYFFEIPKQVRAKSQKQRWGSCTWDNKLLFNWKIIMAPLEIIDYIVVHEMCHMVEKNHSSKYWDLVSSIIPEYKKYKEWLKDKGHKLTL
ncbi:DUF45 domain-containing protein [Alkalibaculum sp. M08DMB]|uniref:DUF45 domain-containing protein n=1 Tax=Alkalibaculum sporogenes TaxID=2655001 RepID=A0A6A7K522_9FIRM|nr:SprT family zinc-dependent metalloprotease [Alkalibaculum sporogenes]MPW24498.1 DUF45 domain-containing protein [Alkalibaculum sporogenes]